MGGAGGGHLLRELHVRWQVHANRRQQPAGALLRKVLHAAALIARPLILRAVRPEVHRHKR